MSVIPASVILLIIAACLAVLLRRALAETFFMACVFVIVVLYCFGLLNYEGSLLLGLRAVCCLAVLALACLVANRRRLRGIQPFRGLAVFGAVMALALYLGYDHIWSEADEISYWGTSVKHMYIFDALTTFTAKGRITLPQYFPGSSLLHYFFTRFSGNFAEYPSYVSMYVLYFSALMPLVRDIFTKKRFAPCLGAAVVFTLIPLQAVFHSPYSTLTIDFMVGNVFGMTIIYYFLYGYEKSAYGALMVLCALFLLTALKDLGFVFALTVCLIIFVDLILFKKLYSRPVNTGSEREKFGLAAKARYFLARTAALAFPPLVVALVFLSRRARLKAVGLQPGFSTPTLSDVMNLLTNNNLSYEQKHAAKYCFNALFAQTVPLKFPIAKFALVFIASSAVFAVVRRKTYGFLRLFACALIIVVCLGLYEAVLTLIYVFGFYELVGDQAPVHLASFGRYTSSYIMGMQIFLLLFFIPAGERAKERGEAPESLSAEQGFARARGAAAETKVASAANGAFAFGPMAPEQALKALLGFTAAVLGPVLAVVLAVCLWKITSPALGSQLLLVRAAYPDRFKPRPVSAVGRFKDYITREVKDPIYVISQDISAMWRVLSIGLGELYPYATITDRSYSTIAVDTDVYKNWPNYPPPPAKFSPEQWEEYILENQIHWVYIDVADYAFIKSYGRFFPRGVTDAQLYKADFASGRLLLEPVG